MYGNIGLALAQRGIGAVVINYRLVLKVGQAEDRVTEHLIRFVENR